MSFYLTLPSDSSMNYFPENTISHFITKLPNPIHLKGHWEVGLTELIYPHSWFNVNSSNNSIGYIFEKNGKEVPHKISPGCYETVPDILNAIYVPEYSNKIIFKYNSVTKRVRIKVKNNAKVVLHSGLAEILGFPPMTIQAKGNKSEGMEEGPLVSDPCAHYQVLMVYTDIIEPQIVGDVLAPLLRVVKVTGTDGETVREQYDRPHYLPVNRKMIESLEIVIRTHTGELTSFERGRSYIKLHFRQKHLS